MRNTLLLSLMLLGLPVLVRDPAAQTPPTPPAQPPATPAQAPARPKPVAKPAARTAIVMTVTDPKGATLPGIHVESIGTFDRSGDTDNSGSLRLDNVRAGTYRMRFSGKGYITFEREVVVRAGQTADVDVTLNPAPEEPREAPAAPPPAAPAPAAPAVGPPGQPVTLSILDLLEKEFVGKMPRRESPLGCTGNARSTMIQLNEGLPERLYANAESLYYVLGGEGTVRLNGRENKLVTNSYAIVPRGTSHAFTRQGKRPLILLAIVSGEPCS